MRWVADIPVGLDYLVRLKVVRTMEANKMRPLDGTTSKQDQYMEASKITPVDATTSTMKQYCQWQWPVHVAA